MNEISLFNNNIFLIFTKYDDSYLTVTQIEVLLALLWIGHVNSSPAGWKNLTAVFVVEFLANFFLFF